MEFDVWLNLTNLSLSRKWRTDKHSILRLKNWQLYTDASGYGAGAQLCLNDKQWLKDRFFAFSDPVSTQPIHCKEMDAIEQALFSFAAELRDQHVTILCDNQSVVAAFNNMGGRDLRLSRALKRIIGFCANRNIKLTVDWVPTDIQRADAISRATPIGESTLRPSVKMALTETYQPDVDLFATKVTRLHSEIKYYSRYPEPEATGVNGLTYTGQDEVVYVFPPEAIRRQALTVTRHIKKCLYVFVYNGRHTAELTAFKKVNSKY